MCCGSERGIPKAGALGSQVLKPNEPSQSQGLPGLLPVSWFWPFFPPNKLFLNSLYLLWFTLNRPLKAQAKVWSQRGDSAVRSRVCSEEAVWLEPFLPLCFWGTARSSEQLPPHHTPLTKCSTLKQEGHQTADGDFSNKKPKWIFSSVDGNGT